MHDMLKKLIEKKKAKGDKMSPDYKEAKSNVLKNLMDDMDGMSAEPIKGLKKVTVAAKDEKGLKEGLKKAEDVVQEMSKMGMSEDEASESQDEESKESPEEEFGEDESSEESAEESDEMDLEHMSVEELDALAKKIEEAKKAKQE